ncbi:hypothetical protein [Cerasicoccus frondis]|uniref:hypothetical protein n=1 Tax=Cerasicoccus frondis TaxID=490090 RepID=UPI0028528536|nr:hypothetical protein [Cerasicoccus frondis]
MLDWGGSVYANNLESDLTTPLDGSYVFYLGTFEDFTPSSENISEWAEHWTTIDAVNYNPQYSVFNARHKVSNTDPTGEQGYIWGVRRSRENMEWILITDADWTWPTDGDRERKVNWLVGSATTAIVGYINGENYQMITSPVGDTTPIPVISYELWAKKFFADGDNAGLSSSDANGNGVDNVIEYALDKDPVKTTTGALFAPQAHNSPSEAGLPPAEQGKYLGVVIQPSLDADVEILGWVSPDLSFAENVTAAVIETLPDGSLLIRDPVALGAGNERKFLRLEFLEN